MTTWPTFSTFRANPGKSEVHWMKRSLCVNPKNIMELNAQWVFWGASGLSPSSPHMTSWPSMLWYLPQCHLCTLSSLVNVAHHVIIRVEAYFFLPCSTFSDQFHSDYPLKWPQNSFPLKFSHENKHKNTARPRSHSWTVPRLTG